MNFQTLAQRIKYSINCYTIDIFKDIKEKLFNSFPELKEKNLIFISDGNYLDENKENDTLLQNGIKGNEVNEVNILIDEKEEENEEDIKIMFENFLAGNF